MNSVGAAVKEYFRLLCLAIQCDLLNLPATEQRVKVMSILSRMDQLVNKVEGESEPRTNT
jgi:hypothetical protein